MGAIGHVDGNFYFGQIEEIYRPDIRGKAYVIGGDAEQRKGIVLTKSPLAKKIGIKTGVSIRDAKSVCPGLIVIPANYPLYLHFTHRMREILLAHTDTIRPFGLDEAWIQLYGSRTNVLNTAQEIRRQLWKQLCLTVSIGVGDNLPYAKLGSDLAPIDGIRELWTDDRNERVYPLPVSSLLYVGPATDEKFKRYGITTIGDLARSDPAHICRILKCKNGEMLWTMANGQDHTPVAALESDTDVKSIGHSQTMPRDLVTNDDVKAAFIMLGESVATRMRESGVEAQTINISIRDNELNWTERQRKLTRPTNLLAELIPAAMSLFQDSYRWWKPIRCIGIRGADLIAEGGAYQFSLFDEQRQKIERLERRTDMIRGRFGYTSIQRAGLMLDRSLTRSSVSDLDGQPIFYTYH